MDYLLEMGDRAAFVEVISSDGLGLKGGRDGQRNHVHPQWAQGGIPGSLLLMVSLLISNWATHSSRCNSYLFCCADDESKD